MRRGIYGVLAALALLVGGGFFIYDTQWNDFSSLNHYEALGVAPTASSGEIKRAFRELSLRYHPDKASSEVNTRRFHRIADAARVLSNEESRDVYDAQLKEEQRMRAFQQDQAWQRIRVLPRSRKPSEIVSFYLTEFPWQVLALGLMLLDLTLFFKALVVLGCIVFVFDVASRLLGRVLDAFRPGFVGVAKEIKDDSLRAARARQQKILEERSAQAQTALLRKRRSERLARAEAGQ